MLRIREDWWKGKKYIYSQHGYKFQYIILKRVNFLWWNWWAKVKLKKKIYDEFVAIKTVNILNKEIPLGIYVDLDTMGIKNLIN
jgi:hypothetical protein